MDRSAFYAHLRRRDVPIFGTSLSQRQVEGIEALLDAGGRLHLDHMAHVLAEVYHETGGGMYPVKETVYRHSKNQNPSDATVIARLDAAWRKGQLPWVTQPYWRDGWFGRGGIQLTHKYNYQKGSAVTGKNLVKHPELALSVPISAQIAVEGCKAGIFTGKKLADFDLQTGFDHYGARAIVNGDKKVNGPKVAGYAEIFEAALSRAGWGQSLDVPAVTKPATQPDPAEQPQGILAALVAAILSIFGKGKA
ncbi:glycoside hydrolase family 19 protein [Salipiger thiooxidans]|uniref:glycoside hydrolase family 19 protein n=1 Tax=Salipiger thiooxidans TaxID=282683 RepID=UPI001CD77B1E|nr:glycoside hydrolase family 19 protein [Salipiger thiooxidans]MCA0846128.1 hypothetical protein [Salipiger thiooxidans]